MDNASYIALARQTQLFRQMDVVASNVANANSTAFKAEKMVFNPHTLKPSFESKLDFSKDIGTVRSPKQGELKATHRDLDVAIQGTGYFKVDTPLGERYTRAGSFVVDVDGSLATPEGHKLASAITFVDGDSDVVVNSDGRITVNGGLEERGTLEVFAFDNEQSLKKLGNGLYEATESPRQADISEYKIAQGMLEGSNVSAVGELTKMIKISRSVGSTATMMSDLHDLQLRTIRSVGGSR